MTIDLLYGRSTLPVSPPAGCVPTVIAKRAMPVLAEPLGAVERALAAPVDRPPLRELARGRRSACILICDITRPVPNGLFLPAADPRPAGRRRAARGHHGPGRDGTPPAERRPGAGRAGGRSVGARDGDGGEPRRAADEDHVLLGRTPARGTVVRLDRRLVEADLKIATGLVEPHFMAGWSGGRKVIAPGVAHAETITTFHNAAFMAHPRAANCVLDGNPLHEEQLAIVGDAGRRAGAQHRDRRPAAPGLRQLRRGRPEPSPGGGLRRAGTRGCRWAAASRPWSPARPATRSTGPTTRP